MTPSGRLQFLKSVSYWWGSTVLASIYLDFEALGRTICFASYFSNIVPKLLDIGMQNSRKL